MAVRVCDQAEGLRILSAQSRGAGSPTKPTEDAQGSSSRPHVIAVASGKGGVGKTSISANLAVALAQLGCRTAVLDADLGLANVDVVLNCSVSGHLGDVLRGEASADAIWAEGPAGVRVLSAGSGVEWLANLSAAERRHLIGAALDAAKYADVLVVDTAPGISACVTDFLVPAGEIILLTTPEPTSIADAYALIKTISSLELPAEIELVVNAAGTRAAASRAAASIDSACRKFLGTTVGRWDWIPFDQRVSEAVVRQQPLVELYPGCPVSAWFRRRAADTVRRVCVSRRQSA